MEAKPRDCCLSLCTRYHHDYKKCTLCDCQLFEHSHFEYKELVNHYALVHPEVKLVYTMQTFDSADEPQVVPTLGQKIYYFVKFVGGCNHHY